MNTNDKQVDLFIQQIKQGPFSLLLHNNKITIEY